ncbi:MAG: Cof-type HAD-IIB family hydrolase [Clostridia bacterium]|nr:Cof-type HAD-IIB family hydrolase [Clostridia bacterium]
MIRLVASDIDGTIVGEDNIVTSQNLKAIDDMKQSNINFTICTGKPYAMVKRFCQDLQASYGIFGNGNQIVDLKTGKEIFKKTLSQEEVQFCINLAKKQKLHIHFYTEDELVTPKLLYMDLRNFRLKDTLFHSDLNFKVVSDIEEYIKKQNPTILKLVISSPFSLEKVEKELNEKMNLTIYRIQKAKQYKDKIIDKEYEYLDITPSKTNKSEALTILSKYLNLSSSEVMAIGDNLNDMEMLQNSGIGVAVANAYDAVKQVATYTTTNTVDESGFAEAVYKYISF